MIKQLMEYQIPAVVLLFLAAICVILLVLDIVLLVKHNNGKKRLDKFLSEGVDESLKDSILDKFKRIELLEEKSEDQKREIRDLYGRISKTYQKTGIVRYDAFEENGGRLSFSLAALDEKNNGILMNVMNGREGSYCYIKEVRNGESEIDLGREEEQALKIAVEKN